MFNMKKVSKLIIGIGGNINSSDGMHPTEVGKNVIKKLETLSIKVLKASSWYKSDPIPKSEQPKFFNCVIFATTFLNEIGVLKNLHLLETFYGRIRNEINEPRIIDLDLIDFSGIVYKSDKLVLPHPRAHLRRFVMEPLAELDPFWVHPVINLSAQEIVLKLKDQNVTIYEQHKIID